MQALRIHDHVSAELAVRDPAMADLVGDDVLRATMEERTVAKGSISYLFIRKHGLAPPSTEGSRVDDGEDGLLEYEEDEDEEKA